MLITSRKVMLISLLLIPSLACAGSEDIRTELQSFSVKTGGTRLIYSTGNAGATMTIINPQAYPMLVQSEVVGEDKISKAPFIVTPPLFRLDGHQQSRIKVISTGHHEHGTRESLYWLCLTGIPPEPESDWTDADYKKRYSGQAATLQAQLRIKTCLKLLLRPSSLKGTPDDFASRLTWRKSGKKLTVSNPTPFFMNLRTVRLGAVNVADLNYVPPEGSLELNVPSDAQGPVHWQLITDYGGDSREFTSELN